MEKKLEVKNLTYSYDGNSHTKKDAITDINFSVLIFFSVMHFFCIASLKRQILLYLSKKRGRKTGTSNFFIKFIFQLPLVKFTFIILTL